MGLPRKTSCVESFKELAREPRSTAQSTDLFIFECGQICRSRISTTISSRVPAGIHIIILRDDRSGKQRHSNTGR